MRGWVWILLLGSSVCAEDEVKSRKHRIDEVNDDYDGKGTLFFIKITRIFSAENAELTVAEQHRLIHEEAVRKAHEAAVKAAGHDTNSENTQSNTVTSTETVQSVHTEVVDNASGETIKEKLEVTKKVIDSNGDVREDHFVAEMEDEDLQLEESSEPLEEDPKAAEEPAEKEVHKIQKSEEDSFDAGLENSGKETEESQIQDDEELQKRMDDFSESLGLILTDVVKTQQRLRKELEDDDEENEKKAEVNTKVPQKWSREGLREIEINGVKVLTADKRKSTVDKEKTNNGVFIPPSKVMREHEVDGIKIMTTGINK